MTDFSFVRLDREGEALISGALKIENAAEIRMKLIDMIGKEDRVVITIGEGAEADLSFFQIICSAHRTAVKMGGYFGVAPVRPQAFVRSSRAAGFPREKGCACDLHGNCVWVLGGET